MPLNTQLCSVKKIVESPTSLHLSGSCVRSGTRCGHCEISRNEAYQQIQSNFFLSRKSSTALHPTMTSILTVLLLIAVMSLCVSAQTTVSTDKKPTCYSGIQWSYLCSGMQQNNHNATPYLSPQAQRCIKRLLRIVTRKIHLTLATGFVLLLRYCH